MMMPDLSIPLAEITASTSMPHEAASRVVDIELCTCDRNGMCQVCGNWIEAVQFYRRNPEAITLI